MLNRMIKFIFFAILQVGTIVAFVLSYQVGYGMGERFFPRKDYQEYMHVCERYSFRTQDCEQQFQKFDAGVNND